MTVIAFQAPKDLLAFDGMGIKIDVAKQRETFDTLFTDVQIALRFCNLDYVKAEEAARKLIDAGFLEETGSRLADSVDYLEATVEIMKAALARLEASEDRALGRKRPRK